MKQRTIGAIILLVVLIGCLLIGSKAFGILMGIISVLGFNEFFNVKFDKQSGLDIIKIFGIISVVFIALNNIFYEMNITVTIIFPVLLLTLPIVFFNNNKRYNIVDAMYILGIIYILGLSFNNISVLRNTDLFKCIYIFIIAFMADTYAYIGGMLIGRHKLTTISPKKTIEGSAIGTIMGTVIGSVYYYNVIGEITLFRVVMLSLVLTLMSELGDLLFSSIKRHFEVKDYANLIPGHGGILDRFDSVIYVSLCFMLILNLM